MREDKPGQHTPVNIEHALKELILEEKAALCSGYDQWNLKAVERLSIPSISMADGPNGLRKQKRSSGGHAFSDNYPATCFPSASLLACTWDRNLVREVGGAIGQEARDLGVSVLLAPGANIKRSPLGGRNFEYYSEDPFLSGQIAASFIDGVQSEGVGASLKHFAANNQEHRRFTIDARVDDRTLREIYLRSFEIAVKKAKPWTVMAAYNSLNGHLCSENRWLLTDVLKSEWGFEGPVVSDWGAVYDRVKSMSAGLDLEMPGFKGDGTSEIIEAVKSGQLSVTALDEAVNRILRLINRHKEAAADLSSKSSSSGNALALRASAEGTVLLKNDGGLLPLKQRQRIAIIGEFAAKPRYQGAGSSMVTPSSLDNALDAIRNRCSDKTIAEYAKGYNALDGSTDRRLISEAATVAGRCDVAVVFAGLPAISETEGIDRKNLRLPEGMNALISAVSKANRRTVVVLMNGAPIEMPWAFEVTSIIEAYLCGQAGGTAISSLIFGDANPCGKLAETFPLRLEDNPSFGNFPGGPSRVLYQEGIFVGYRHYEMKGLDVLFPFGHGLSYTQFTYDDLRLSADLEDGRQRVRATFRLRNSGGVRGAEVVQLYIREVKPAVTRPEKELKGFEKAFLGPGESREIEIILYEDAFSYWDETGNRWRIGSGEFEILVGSSSADIRLRGTVSISGIYEDSTAAGVNEGLQKHANIDAAVRPDAMMQGDTVENAEVHKGRTKWGSYTANTPLMDMSGPAAVILRSALTFAAWAATRGNADNPTARNATAILRMMPLRALPFITEGSIGKKTVSLLVRLVNWPKRTARHQT